MSSDNIAISVSNLSKCYQIYNAPRDRLKQFILPRLQRLANHPQHHYFREFWALKNVSFEVRKGESVGIIGRNGSGKSTLLQMIAGTLSPTLGKVEITGRVAALLELGSGFNADFTGRENVFMNAAVLGLSREEITSRFAEIAAFANIGDFIEQPVKMYSSGMLVRLAFAVSVCVNPDILIIDEALAVGDMAFQFKCLERLHELIEKGTTLLFVSHDINLVRSFCDQALLLDQGQTAVFGSSLEVTETYLMHARQEQMASSNDRIVNIKPRVATNSRFAFGSEQGQISNVMFAETQSTKAFFSTGDTASVTMDVEYAESVNFPCISLIILDQRMVVLTGRYFTLNKRKPQDHVSRHRLTFKFEIPFAPGEYFITVRFEERVSDHLQILIDKLVGALSFDVFEKEKKTSWGVLDMNIDFLDHDAVRHIADEEWLALLCAERHDQELIDFVSEMPSEQIQLKFAGATGKVTLTQAFEFYKLAQSCARKFGLDSRCNVLDFGCGWGRITRFFVKDVANGQLYGVDPLPEIIEICKATVKRVVFNVINPLPPIPQFSPNMFNIIYAYSVFSHLNEQYTNLWFQEFSRLLKKGGLLIVTTRSRSFIEHTALLRRSDANPASPQSSVQSFVNTRQVLSDYDAGKYCHEPTGGGDKLSKEFFGETCIPKKYFEQNFSDIFIIDDIIENLTFEPNQACIIMRKR